MNSRPLRLRGIAVHNLQKIDLDLNHGDLICICGVSGSGKTSLALDTLYAEGQRRYIESFPASARQYLQRLDRPAAEQIEGIPPAIAVTRENRLPNNRATIGSATEILDYLRLLYAKIGQVECLDCGVQVIRHSPESISKSVQTLPQTARIQIGFPCGAHDNKDADLLVNALREQGFIRAIIDGKRIDIAEAESEWFMQEDASDRTHNIDIIIDRLKLGKASDARLCDALEMAMEKGEGRCSLFVQVEDPAWQPDPALAAEAVSVEGEKGWRLSFCSALLCPQCDREYWKPERSLFNFNSPLGACSQCEGLGTVVDVDYDLVIPNPTMTLREGAIAPWNASSYSGHQEALFALAEECNIPLDSPYSAIEPHPKKIIIEGHPEHDYIGLFKFFESLKQDKSKKTIRSFLNPWMSDRPCPACQGKRLRPEALAVKIKEHNLADLSEMRIDHAVDFFKSLELTPWEQTLSEKLFAEVESRLRYLQHVGLGYLTLSRSILSLSGGESQRAALTSSLGSNLVNMLYILDEPSAGLHPSDRERLVQSVLELRDRSNTVVVIEHDASILSVADEIIEIGPGGGEQGGQIIFQGKVADLLVEPNSVTGPFLSGRQSIASLKKGEPPEKGAIRLSGAKGNNLCNLSVDFPLQCLCVVSGKSGAGKTSLVLETLYPALRHQLPNKENQNIPIKSLPYDAIAGVEQIDDVILIDQTPVGRSPRSNPVTYIKAFDEIRAVFANTLDARSHNLSVSHFSFNSKQGGRCSTCSGDGALKIDMQFLADVYMTCPQCKGRRYRPDILEIKYRNRSIADVLEMTARQAFQFFRGQKKVQEELKRLIDVGLDYIRLGQPANTLSSGESQRLKLAAYLSTSGRGKSLFLLDEPTLGLHYADVAKLLECLETLIQVGNSVIVIEHNLQLLAAADYIIDMGPGAAEEGGRIISQGTPEQVANDPQSITGPYLAKAGRAQQLDA